MGGRREFGERWERGGTPRLLYIRQHTPTARVKNERWEVTEVVVYTAAYPTEAASPNRDTAAPATEDAGRPEGKRAQAK